jgi:hypothetical protein
MKNLTTRISGKTGLILLLFFSLSTLITKGAEFVIMNRVISWDLNAQDAFWVIQPDANMPANWKSPDDYFQGTIYTRYEVLSVATNTQFGVQFGIFQWNPDRYIRTQCGELCELVRPLQGAGSVATNSSSPSSWWEADGGVDFARVADFQSMSVIIYSMNPKWPVGKPGEGGDPAGVAWSQRFNWFPVTLRVTVVAVSKGSTFSGWDKYIIDPSARQPTPDYGIDYINETTDQAVPSTVQFSMYSGMSGAIDGTGSKMPITPGQDANFRTKAGSGLYASEIQHFRAPVRPATPTFVLDKVNHQTTTGVSSDFEYSSHPNMSDAVSGDGSKVSIPEGTTRYFRQKATASSFKSNVQSLAETNKLPIAHELLIFNDTIEYPNSTDTNGFYYFYYNADMPADWRSPDDYYYGEVYTRYEILSEKTEAPVGLQFGIWQMMPPETGELHETMSDIQGMNGTGSVVYNHSSPYKWWKLDPYVDYTKMNMNWHFGINPWQIDPREQQIRQEIPDVWAQRNAKWFPMKVYVTIIAVAANKEFSGWDNYVNTNPGAKKSMPAVGIDYINEMTNAAVPSSIEYSTSANMAYATDGSGQKLVVTPGQDLYFRTKPGGGLYASDIQHLVVPARPAAPVIGIDFQYENTSENVPTDIEYSDTVSFSTFSNSNGYKINMTPGQIRYFRKQASPTAFISEVFMLKAPARPAGPAVTIDYANERTHEVLSSFINYSTNASMTNPVACQDAPLALTPGTTIYLQSGFTDTSYTSLINSLVVPARPAAPSVTVDFVQEKTAQNVAADVQYASSSAFTSPSTGSGNKIALTPGNDLFLRKKGTNSSFTGEILHLVVPGRIFLDYLGKDTVTANKFTMFAILNGAVAALNENNIQVINGVVQNLHNGNVFDVYPAVIGPVVVSIPVNAIDGGNFASNELTVYNNWIPTGIPTVTGDLFRVYPNPSSERVITIQSNQNRPYSLNIYSVDGSLMMTFEMNSSEYQQINLNDLQKGLYLLKIGTPEGTHVQKLVLE